MYLYPAVKAVTFNFFLSEPAVHPKMQENITPVWSANKIEKNVQSLKYYASCLLILYFSTKINLSLYLFIRTGWKTTKR